MRKLGKVGALERIGRRDRSDRDTDVQSCQHDQRMVYPVGGKDSERPIWTKFVIEQILGQCQRRLASFAVANPPLAFGRLLDDEVTVRGFPCPAIQPIADPIVVTRQRLDGSHDERAIRLTGQLNVGREESYWPQGRLKYGSPVVKCAQCPKLNRCNSWAQGLC